MKINVKYTVQLGGIKSGVYSIHESDDAINQASVWLTDNLSLGFSSMEDIMFPSLLGRS